MDDNAYPKHPNTVTVMAPCMVLMARSDLAEHQGQHHEVDLEEVFAKQAGVKHGHMSTSRQHVRFSVYVEQYCPSNGCHAEGGCREGVYRGQCTLFGSNCQQPTEAEVRLETGTRDWDRPYFAGTKVLRSKVHLCQVQLAKVCQHVSIGCKQASKRGGEAVQQSGFGCVCILSPGSHSGRQLARQH